ncbi:MAG TPA: low specificity L-threonine aldolase [Anaeromyxobacteraceae bacterium]
MTPSLDGPPRRHFASDNYAGICPEAWEAMARANAGHVPGYGDDAWTERAAALVRELFETDCEVFLVFNGTSANALAVAALCRPWHAVACHEVAHVSTDECAAPELLGGGVKVIPLAGPQGKVTPEALRRLAGRRDDVHFPRVRAVSLTQATELGTVYRPAEVAALAEAARGLGIRLHVDGARFANAVASLGLSPAALSWQAGVDVLSLGGTKDGMAAGEAVVFFDRELAREFAWRRKQAGQLASKMRFLAAPWVGMLESGAWLRNARHANAMAARLEAAVRAAPGVRLLQPREANAVFAAIPGPAVAALHGRGWRFYDFEIWGGSRLMCSWDTAPEDVDRFASDLREVMGGI